jgi:hypothetical protein
MKKDGFDSLEFILRLEKISIVASKLAESLVLFASGTNKWRFEHAEIFRLIQVNLSD